MFLGVRGSQAEYAESMLPRLGRLQADIWYLRQTLSFLPRHTARGRIMGRILLFVSLFTLIRGCWLAVMEMVLRHPG